MSKPRVAILGLGIMGSGMAGRLLSASFPLTLYNRNRDKAAAFAANGAAVAESPREAAANAHVVISIVADDMASRAMWMGAQGALAGAADGAVLIESSTVSVAWALELANAAAGKGCAFLDAPVTGTKPHAASGQLLFLVGGPADALERVRPVLAVVGRDAVHLGANGNGARMKLINNFLSAVQVASFAEASAMIDRAGLDQEKAFSVLMNGAPGSPLLKAISARAVANDPEVNFVLRLMAKDIRYAIEDAVRNEVKLETAAAALSLFQGATAKGYGDEDMWAVVKSLRQERHAGKGA
jgi:3-hydroxyisobutyrate dehydrogenase